MTDRDTDTVELTFEFETPLTAETLYEHFSALAERMEEVKDEQSEDITVFDGGIDDIEDHR